MAGPSIADMFQGGSPLAWLMSKADQLKRRINHPGEFLGSLNQQAIDFNSTMQKGANDSINGVDSPERRIYENTMMGIVMGVGPQATVYHGSPYSFDKFDASKIGTGEGAQAYGYGHYVAESPEVAKTYAGPVRFDYLTKEGAPFYAADGYQQAALNLVSHHGTAERALSKVRTMSSQRGNEGLIGALEEMSKQGVHLGKSGGGNQYKIDLPDEAISKMLDWDKPLSEQPEAVRNAFAKAYRASTGKYPDFPPSSISGATAYDMITGGALGMHGYEDIAARGSGRLSRYGIPGIRYLDQGSRTAGKGTYNYVVFPGNEDLLKILERNGAPLMSEALSK